MPEANGRHRRALILFGPPGSGKGTQALLVKETLGIAHISTGDMLRERMLAGDAFGSAIKKLVDNGELVTDELVNRMVEERIEAGDCAAGFILDGYPRTLSQAETITRLLTSKGIGWIVVHLKVDYNVIIRRLAGRRHCPRCGAVYNTHSNTPKSEGVCDSCGAGLTVRDDDKEFVVRRRLDAYDEQTRPLIEYFSGNGSPFCEVNGATPAPEIGKKVCEVWTA